MAIHLTMQPPVLAFAAPDNAAARKWGVYAIPRMWKDARGQLIIRVNGEMDSADVNTKNCAPTVWLTSRDGTHWARSDREFDIRPLQGIGPHYLTLRSGDVIAIREKADVVPISGIPHRKEFLHPCGEAVLHTYRWAEIPPQCRGLERLRFPAGGDCPEITDVTVDFPERELLVNALAKTEDGSYLPMAQYLKPDIFRNPYLCSMVELPDGTLAALTVGQSPDVSARYCTEIYLLVSSDGGVTWTKRSTVAAVTGEYEALACPFGYGGDGQEVSLAVTPGGVLLCAMRMDLSISPELAKMACGTMLTRSTDGGYTWEKPFPVSDESVTPHILALPNGVCALVYGRPGVHVIVSEDDFRTFSAPYSIIGKTLCEERRLGRSDLDSKYRDSVSYSNTFTEVLSDDTFLVLYTDLKYPGEDGALHKATMTRTITVAKQP